MFILELFWQKFSHKYGILVRMTSCLIMYSEVLELALDHAFVSSISQLNNYWSCCYFCFVFRCKKQVVEEACGSRLERLPKDHQEA